MFKFFASVRLALLALRRNILRTVLTMLGIIIGVAAVIVIVAITQGANAQMEKEVASMGRNVILIIAGSVSRGGVRSSAGSAGTLTVEDVESIRKEVPGVVRASANVRINVQAASPYGNWSTLVQGVDLDFFKIRAWELEDGSFFTPLDARAANKVCILGETARRELFPDGDAVGQVIRVKKVPLVVIGTLKPKGASSSGSDYDDTIITPASTAMKRLAGVTTISSINAEAENFEEMEKTVADLTSLLRQRHKIGEGKEADFSIFTQQEIAEFRRKQSETMTGLLFVVATVSLVIGGVGIMNIMLVSVTERTREIGIRMAIGARGFDILQQFLIEAITLSAIGGALGVALAVGVSELVAFKKGWPVLISPHIVTIAILFSAVIGVAFGFYPAYKASKLDPIDALRYE